MGAFRVVGDAAPPDDVWNELEPVLPEGGTVAVARGNRPNRYTALVLNASGLPVAFAKIALDAEARSSLERERYAVSRIADALRPPVFAPAVIDATASMLLFEAVRWRPRWRSWQLPSEVAYALGVLFARTSEDRALGIAHGDLAPWNVLHGAGGWALIDWEDSRPLPVLYDLFHFLIQSNLDLHLPSTRAILAAVDGRGPFAPLVVAYAEGASLDVGDTRDAFRTYLRVSSDALDPNVPDHRPGLRKRRHLAGLVQ
jgi:hypothetical protein